MKGIESNSAGTQSGCPACYVKVIQLPYLSFIVVVRFQYEQQYPLYVQFSLTKLGVHA